MSSFSVAGFAGAALLSSTASLKTNYVMAGPQWHCTALGAAWLLAALHHPAVLAATAPLPARSHCQGQFLHLKQAKFFTRNRSYTRTAQSHDPQSPMPHTSTAVIPVMALSSPPPLHFPVTVCSRGHVPWVLGRQVKKRKTSTRKGMLTQFLIPT